MIRGKRLHLIIFLLAFILLTASENAGYAQEGSGAGPAPVVSKGIYLQGIDLSGMTQDEVMEAAAKKIDELGQTQVTVTAGDRSGTCTLSELGLSWRNRGVISEIFHLGATGNIVQRYKDRKDLEHSNKQFLMTFDISKKKALRSSTVNQIRLNPNNLVYLNG